MAQTSFSSGSASGVITLQLAMPLCGVVLETDAP